MQLSPVKPSLELQPEGEGDAGEEKMSLRARASLRLQVDKMSFYTFTTAPSSGHSNV